MVYDEPGAGTPGRGRAWVTVLRRGKGQPLVRRHFRDQADAELWAMILTEAAAVFGVVCLATAERSPRPAKRRVSA